MSRLSIITSSQAEATVEELYRDLERRIIASPPGLCPLDLASSFLKVCAAQTCGKCVPCRVGLPQLERLIEDILDGKGTLETIDLIESTAESIFQSADCAIGFEAALMVLKGVRGFRDDYVEHVTKGRCTASLSQPVPCVSLCPAHVDIPGYIALVHEGRYADAVRLIRKDNPFPVVCAMVCEHPCERRCRRNIIDDSVNIRGLKLYAVDHAGEVPVFKPGQKPAPKTGKRVAVVGGGPSGISAAYYLALMGHSVEIFEQRKHLGGMLRYGIPSYRLPREALDGEISTLLTAGDIKVHLETPAGGDNYPLTKLREDFDAVYIAIGAHTDKSLGIPGEEAKGVVSAVDILRRIGDNDYPDLEGKNVIVVGDGNVAMDCARSAYFLVTGKNPDPDAFKDVRGYQGKWREASFDLPGRKLRIGVAHGLGNIRALCEAIEKKEVDYDFVEMMACPTGCAGGGGQPIHGGEELGEARGLMLWDIDRKSDIRFSHDNPSIQQCYKDFLGAPLGDRAHHLLHTDQSQWELWRG